jgi:CHAP domain
MRYRLTPRARSIRLVVGLLAGSALVGAGIVPASASAAATSSRWSSWESLGGSLTGAPDAASWRPGRVDVFGRGTDGHLHHRGWPSAQGWSAYDDLGAIASDPASVSITSGRLDVFARFTDGVVHQRTYTTAAGWNSWRGDTVRGQVSGSPDAASSGDGSLGLVARDSVGHLLLNRYTPSSGWTGWQSQGGILTADPSVVSWSPGHYDVFGRGRDNALWHLYWSGGRAVWESRGGVLAAGPDAASDTYGHLDVAVEGTGGGVYQLSYAPGRWSPWRRLPGAIRAAPGITSWGPGRLDLFVRGTSGALDHSWQGTATSQASSLPSSIVALAGTKVGTGESPAGSNCTPFEPTGTCLPWCTYFATWVWHQASSALPSLSFSGSVYSWAVANGRWKAGPSRPAPGDIVVYGASSASTVHTGIVASVGSGAITTIDGNYSDQVMRVGPFDPALATSPARILGYASPVPLTSSGRASARSGQSEQLTTPPAATLAQIRSQDGGR